MGGPGAGAEGVGGGRGEWLLGGGGGSRKKEEAVN